MSEDKSEGPRPDGEPGREGWLEKLIGRFSPKARESSRDDLEEVLAAATEAAELSPRERLMLKNVLGFHRVRVSDVMVPRADMIAVASDTSLADLLELFRTAGHSRLPVYGETLDEPLGMVHIRDFLDHLARGGQGPDAAAPGPEAERAAAGSPRRPSLGDVDLSVDLASANILRPVLFVPRSMPAIDLLARMQASRTHMALVIDEYGGTDGIVSIEDLVETVVGDIEDEHDETEHMIVREEGGTFLVDARAFLEDVSEALGIPLEAEEIDTLGGLVVATVGRVPSRGEMIPGPSGLEFEVIDADPRRLKRVRIHGRGATETPPDRAGPAEPAAKPDPAP